MLEDDRHLFRVFVQQVIGEHNTGDVGAKTNVKVVSAAQPLSGCARKRLAYHPAGDWLCAIGGLSYALAVAFFRWRS